ncbi:MAG: GGDEF domain-containing protein, partial [Persicimonas sp.]
IDQVVEADRAVAFLLEDGAMQLYVEVGNDGSTVGEVSDWVFGDPRLEELLESGRPRLSSEWDEYDGPGVELGEDHSWMGVPIVARGELAGILIVERDEPHAYGEDQVHLVQALAGQAGIAIENARLFAEVERLAIVDELTGLPNRRRLFALLDEEFERARRYEEPLSVILLDIDHFKKVNDEYGHAVGDAVLREVARRCADSLRQADTMGRYGGEEFVVVMPKTAIGEAADNVARRLRRVVAGEPFEAADVSVEVTISIGVAQLDPSDETIDDLLNRADTALYAAKAAGRNTVRRASQDESVEE